MIELNIPKATTLIQCCTGYVFQGAIRDLIERGYHVITEKITGTLQNYGEQQYKKYLESIGIFDCIVGRSKESIGDWIGRVDEVLKYLRDHPELYPYCKMGWKAFRSIEGNEST